MCLNNNSNKTINKQKLNAHLIKLPTSCTVKTHQHTFSHPKTILQCHININTTIRINYVTQSSTRSSKYLRHTSMDYVCNIDSTNNYTNYYRVVL